MMVLFCLLPLPNLCSMDYIPSESALNLSSIAVDSDTKAMLEKLGLNIAVSVKEAHRRQPNNNRTAH